MRVDAKFSGLTLLTGLQANSTLPGSIRVAIQDDGAATMWLGIGPAR